MKEAKIIPKEVRAETDSMKKAVKNIQNKIEKATLVYC